MNEGTDHYNKAAWRRIGYAEAFHTTSKVFMQKRDYANAKLSLHLALEIQKLYSIEDKKRAELLYDLGIALQKQRAYREAVKAFEESMSIRASVLGNNNALVADCYFQIGMSCHASEFSKALSSHQHALKIREKLPDDLKTAESCYMVACMFFNAKLSVLQQSVGKKELDKAVVLIEKACSIWKMAAGKTQGGRKQLREIKKYMLSTVALCEEIARSSSQIAQRACEATALAVQLRELLGNLEAKLEKLPEDAEDGLTDSDSDTSFKTPPAL